MSRDNMGKRDCATKAAPKRALKIRQLPSDRKTQRPQRVREPVRSTELGPAPSLEFITAVHETLRIGLAPNAMMTIDLEKGAAQDCVRTLGMFLAQIRKWIVRHGSNTAYVWIQETGAVVGQHVHILIHLPPQHRRKILKLHRRWLAAAGTTSTAGLLKTVTIGSSPRAAFGDNTSRAAYLNDLIHVVDYCLKGASVDARKELAILHVGKGGTVLGKRAGTSQNIGRAARARRGASFVPRSPSDIAFPNKPEVTPQDLSSGR